MPDRIAIEWVIRQSCYEAVCQISERHDLKTNPMAQGLPEISLLFRLSYTETQTWKSQFGDLGGISGKEFADVQLQ